MKKYLHFALFAILVAIPFTFISCGDDEDDDDISGGSIVGTWTSDLIQDMGELWEDSFETFMAYYQFNNDGTYTYVDVTVYKDDWVEEFGDPKEEIIVEKGKWHTSGDKIYVTATESTDPEASIGETLTYEYQVNGNKLILTWTRGIIFSTTFTRIPDKTIEKYLK